MTGPLRKHALRELAVPIVALAAACVLVAAALLPSNDPELTARVALERLTGQVETEVSAAWRVFARAGVLHPCYSLSTRPLEAGAAEARHGPLAEPENDALCAVLLDEVDRDLLSGADPDALRASIQQALEAARGEVQLARALRAELSVALRAGDGAAARTALTRLFASCGGAAARGTTSEVLLAWIEASEAGSAMEETWSQRLVDAAEHGTLALPLADLRIELAPGSTPCLEVQGLEAGQALLQRLRARPEGVRIALAIQSAIDQHERAALMSSLGYRSAADPAATTGVTWAAAHLDAWSFVARGEFVAAVRLAADERELCMVMSAADLARDFRQMLQAREVLPQDFDVRIELPSNPSSGDTLSGIDNAHVLELAPGVLRAAVIAPAVESYAADAVRRVALLRGAFVVLAAFCLVAGWATWRALVRERKLAELRTLFVANVSHELRTPLASILLLADNLAEGRVRTPEQAARYHASIQREALRLRELVDSVLDLSRLERGKPLTLEREELQLAPWWQGCAAELAERAATRGATLDVHTGPLEASATCDGNALRRALFNLMDNALKHSGSTRIEASAEVRDGALELSVRDHGRGVPVAERERLFEPFERLRDGREAAPGAGLGLSIVRAIAAAHGGTVTCTDAGPGARFELSIPLGSESVSMRASAPRSESASGGDPEPRSNK
jgi:signal transduction histidine kinase